MDVRKRTVSFWIKRTDTGKNPALVGFFLNTSDGRRYVELVFSGGNDGLYNYGGDYIINYSMEYFLRTSGNALKWI